MRGGGASPLHENGAVGVESLAGESLVAQQSARQVLRWPHSRQPPPCCLLQPALECGESVHGWLHVPSGRELPRSRRSYWVQYAPQ